MASSSRVKNPFKKSSPPLSDESQPMAHGNDESNPFESESGHAPSSSSSSSSGAWGRDPPPNDFNDPPASSAGGGIAERSTTGLTEAELNMREANIKAREERLRKKEDDLDQRAQNIGANLYPNNWPCKWWAIAYNDITGDIPEEKQAYVRRFYRAVLFTYFVLVFNAITVIVTIIETCASFSAFLWAIIYCICGFPIAWSWWYKPIYQMNRKGSGGLRWILFFVVFGIHWIFLILLIIGYNSGGGAGIFAVIEDLSGGCKASTLFAIADTVFSGLLFLWSSYLMQAAWRVWKKGGGSLKGVQSDVTSAAASAAAHQALENV